MIVEQSQHRQKQNAKPTVTARHNDQLNWNCCFFDGHSPFVFSDPRAKCGKERNNMRRRPKNGLDIIQHFPAPHYLFFGYPCSEAPCKRFEQYASSSSPKHEEWDWNIPPWTPQTHHPWPFRMACPTRRVWVTARSRTTCLSSRPWALGARGA